MTSNYTPPSNGGTPDMLPTEVDPDAPLAERVAKARALAERQYAAPEMREPRPQEMPDMGLVEASDPYRTDFIAAPWSRAGWESAAAAERSMYRVQTAIRDAIDTAEAIVADNATWPGYRFEKFGENIAKTDATVREALDAAEVALTVAEATAIGEALPQARTEDKRAADPRAARMLESAKRISDMGPLLRKLAARSDEVGALVTDRQWLDDTLLGLGYDAEQRESLHKLVMSAALAAAAASDDRKRADAARAIKAVAAGRKGLAALRSGWQVTRGRLDARGKREIPVVTTVRRYA
ncbi:hypothetical protein [Micromonospora sp. NPDC004551]|uniref:hypothetical protein n=1 Tax=Micromonospora sp. NPDC004551 TaxID=3154284 RepID=UPI0033A6ED85